MKFGGLMEVTGGFVKESVKWLKEEQQGCSSVCFNTDDTYNYAVCIGWHHYDDERQPDGKFKAVWKIAWKIGRQTTNNAMQCDFDIDFEMPYNEDTGDVDDTCEVIETAGRRPAEYRSWNALAAHIRKTARRVWKDWKEVSDDGS